MDAVAAEESSANFVCQFCAKEDRSQLKLEIHILTWHPIEWKLLRCLTQLKHGEEKHQLLAYKGDKSHCEHNLTLCSSFPDCPGRVCPYRHPPCPETSVICLIFNECIYWHEEFERSCTKCQDKQRPESLAPVVRHCPHVKVDSCKKNGTNKFRRHLRIGNCERSHAICTRNSEHCLNNTCRHDRLDLCYMCSECISRIPTEVPSCVSNPTLPLEMLEKAKEDKLTQTSPAPSKKRKLQTSKGTKNLFKRINKLATDVAPESPTKEKKTKVPTLSSSLSAATSIPSPEKVESSQKAPSPTIHVASQKPRLPTIRLTHHSFSFPLRPPFWPNMRPGYIHPAQPVYYPYPNPPYYPRPYNSAPFSPPPPNYPPF